MVKLVLCRVSLKVKQADHSRTLDGVWEQAVIGASNLTRVSEVRDIDLETLADIYEELIGDNVDIQLPRIKLLEVARTYINKEDRNIFVLRDEQGTPQGMIACAYFDNPYLLFKSRTAQEIVWAVRKPYRRHSKMLLDMFFSWSKEH